MRPNERLAQQNLSNFDRTPQLVSGHHKLVDDNHDTQNGPQLQKLLVSLHAAITRRDGHTHVSRTMSDTTRLCSPLLSAQAKLQAIGLGFSRAN